MPHRFLTCCSQREIQNEISECKIEVGAFKIAKSYKTTLAVITQPLFLHYVSISHNMKPHSLEFTYLERENSYTCQIRRGCKI